MEATQIIVAQQRIITRIHLRTTALRIIQEIILKITARTPAKILINSKKMLEA